MSEQRTSLMNPAVRALIGKTTPVMEMYGTIDQETVRRYVVGIPDQDPRHWDADLATPRFGGTTAPGTMLIYTALRMAPWHPDTFHRLMLDLPTRDVVPMMRPDAVGIEEVREAAGTSTHLHAGDEVEFYQYPKLGDRIFSQARYANIVEKVGRNGQPFLLTTTEIRYWNQHDETLLIARILRIES